MSTGVPWSWPAARRSAPAGPCGRGPLLARAAALRILADWRHGRWTGREAIDALVEHHELADSELGLTTELVMGVVRHRITLARVLGHLAARGWKRINRRLRYILMLGGYQLIWLDGIPPFAAVNEAVELAKKEGGPPAGRFVNAILRELVRQIEHRRIPSNQADAVRALWIDERSSCQFRRPVLPDPARQPIEHLADATSHPAWLVSRWAAAFGMQRATQICRAGMCRPPVFLRPNRGRTDAAGLVARLKQAGLDAQLTAAGEALVVGHTAGLKRWAAFAEGWFQPQDRTAMEVVSLMGLSPGQTVIDLCAGLGTKTTQIAEAMNDRGLVLACDKDGRKLALVRANCQRLGCSIVRTVLSSEIESAAATVGSPAWILIDGPCSNTGVLARRPEARYRVNRRSLAALAAVQRELLALATRLAGERTRLLYSTCSLEPEENEQVTTWFARSHLQWRLSASQRTFPSCGPDPSGWRDGGYRAIWVRE